MSGLDFRFEFATLAYGPGAEVLLLAALALDALFGAWPGLRRVIPHPALVLAGLVGELTRRLNKPERGGAARLVRGAIVLIAVAAVAYVAGRGVEILAGDIPFVWIIALLFISSLMVMRGPFDEAGQVTAGFSEGALAGARRSASAVFGPRAEQLTAADLIRAVLEHLAGRLGDGLAGGIFWFLLAGLPGLAVYRAVNIAGRLLDDAKPDMGLFGLVPTRVNEAVSLLPALLAALVACVAAIFVPGAGPAGALGGLLRNGFRSGRLGEGPVISAFAGAFGMTLGGHGGGAEPGGKTLAEIVRGQYLYAVTALLLFALVIVIGLGRHAV